MTLRCCVYVLKTKNFFFFYLIACINQISHHNMHEYSATAVTWHCKLNAILGYLIIFWMGCGFIKMSALNLLSTELNLKIFTIPRVLIFEVVFYKYKVQTYRAESTFVRLQYLSESVNFLLQILYRSVFRVPR